MKKAVVLGCGPAGLLAAHAAKLTGHNVTVISNKVKSRIGGAQYLHHHIPDLTPEEPQGDLIITSMGTREGYARKVYGDPEAPVSWDLFVDNLEQDTGIWDIVEMYDKLWEEWESSIINFRVKPLTISDLLMNHQAVISTIPAVALCSGVHSFEGQEILVNPRFHDVDSEEDNTIVYNGDDDYGWYRSSVIFGRGMTEYSTSGVVKKYIPDSGGLMFVNKPLSTDCNCFPRLLKVGRYGKWHKGDLVTDAFDEVYHALS